MFDQQRVQQRCRSTDFFVADIERRHEAQQMRPRRGRHTVQNPHSNTIRPNLSLLGFHSRSTSV